MSEHYNLYYLLREDQEKNPMRPEANEKILKNLENFYQKIKPPWKPEPPNSIRDEKP